MVRALASHHPDNAGQPGLLRRVHGALAPGGVIVNAEQVAAPSPFLADLYAGLHERRARPAGTGGEEWRAARERIRFRHLATVEDQLTWLGDAGYEDADCLFEDHCFAVLLACRPAARQG